ncbi:MAG: accessory factor UbiK family protein [Deltaproteobacteria bacterium]|nr:accessory factor UbiK family protein [Deltaproteobacteria bacterium]
MADLLDKAILIGIGLEKKAKEVLDELQQAGKNTAAAGAAPEGGTAEPISAKQMIENKVVEDGVKALKEFLLLVKAGKEKIEKDVSASSEKVMEKLHMPTQSDIDIVKEMARIAREKVDKLEKRVAELEAKLGKAE